MKMCCRKSGFTLIEVLVTLVVVAIGLASILPMLSAGIFGDSSAADITIALNSSIGRNFVKLSNLI